MACYSEKRVTSSPSLGLFTCSSLQGSLRPCKPMTLSFPLEEEVLSGDTAEEGGSADDGLKPTLHILGPVGAGESFQC